MWIRRIKIMTNIKRGRKEFLDRLREKTREVMSDHHLSNYASKMFLTK